jgi:hypothetical protein
MLDPQHLTQPYRPPRPVIGIDLLFYFDTYICLNLEKVQQVYALWVEEH